MALREDLQATLNAASAENASNTPDFILAEYLVGCLEAFDTAVAAREGWYGRDPAVGPAGMSDVPGDVPDDLAQVDRET